MSIPKIVLLATSLATAPAFAQAPVAFKGVTVVDVERGTLVPQQPILISGNRIQAMGDDVATPPGASVVDARGQYVIPGLWDMHAHVGAFFEFTPTLLLAKAFSNPDDAALFIEDRMRLLPAGTRERWRAAPTIPELQGPPEQRQQMYRTMARAVSDLHKGGALILAGSDVPAPYMISGFSLHDELAALVDDAGLSPLDALRSATLNPANTSRRLIHSAAWRLVKSRISCCWMRIRSKIFETPQRSPA